MPKKILHNYSLIAVLPEHLLVGQQELNEVAGVDALGRGVEAHVEVHGPRVEMLGQRLQIG